MENNKMSLYEITCVIDTREKNKKRINAVRNFIEAHNGIVEFEKLELCDYYVHGWFRDHDVHIGIEAKSLADFCSCDYVDLKRKLFDSFDLYDEVALFIEVGNYSFEAKGFNETTIINPSVKDGSANVCSLSKLEGCCSTLSKYGIHVRQLRSEHQFSYSIANLLTYIVEPDHLMISRSDSDYTSRYKQMLLTILSPDRTEKIMKVYPNLYWLASIAEEHLTEIIGKKPAKELYEFIRYKPQDIYPSKTNNNDGESSELNSNQSLRNSVLFSPPNFENKTHSYPNKSLITQIASNSEPSLFSPTLNSPQGEEPAVKKSTTALMVGVERPPIITVDLLAANTIFSDQYEYKEVEPNRPDINKRRMDLKSFIKELLVEPHTMEEIVDKCDDWSPGRVFDMVMGGVKSGYIEKIGDGKETYKFIFMR